MNVTMPLPHGCPHCASPKGVLPERPSAASVVRCAGCSREIGALHDVRQELRRIEQQNAAERAMRIRRSVRRA